MGLSEGVGLRAQERCLNPEIRNLRLQELPEILIPLILELQTLTS